MTTAAAVRGGADEVVSRFPLARRDHIGDNVLMSLLGTGPGELHSQDASAQSMFEGGYWITDFHAVFTDAATFRAGRWIEMTTRVERIGDIALSPDFPLAVAEHGNELETEVYFARRPPGGNHPLHVSVDGKGSLLAVMMKFGVSQVSGWTPALCEKQRVPELPGLPVLRTRCQRLVFAHGDTANNYQFGKLVHHVCVFDDRAFGVDTGDQEQIMCWWGLDQAGELAAFVIDVRGSTLREPGEVKGDARTSCPRIVKDEASLVRRLERLCARGLLELEDGADKQALARAFFAQPMGNLRTWLLEAPGVIEVY